MRFLGKQRLGLSCGLVGTGMGFRREVLLEAPWTSTGLVEDGEYHMRLVLAGVRTEFVAEAWVSQAVPTSMGASREQQARWEKGKAQMVRDWTPRLLAAGVARRDPVRLHAGAECLVPPQSVIALGGALGIGLGAAARNRPLVGLSLLTLARAERLRARRPAPRPRARRGLPGAAERAAPGRLEARPLRPPAQRPRAPRLGADRTGERVKLAFLCSEYPAISHTFVLREIESLRAAGLDIDTFTIRRTPPEKLLSDLDRRAAESTFAILPPRVGQVLGAHLRVARRSPRAYARALRRALGLAPAGLRGRVWQAFYFAEAVVLLRQLERRGIRHVHVHLANVAADVAMIAAGLGTDLDPAGR